MKFFDEDLHLNESAQALYVDAVRLGTLDQVPEPILEHVSECTKCMADVEELYESLEGKSYPKEHPYFRTGARTTRSPLVIVYRMAAVLLISFGIYGIMRLGDFLENRGSRISHVQSSQQSESPADSAVKKDVLLGDNFAVHPELERLVNTNYRSGEVEVASPRLGEKIGGNVVFRWKGASGKEIMLKIFDNRGKELHSKTLRHERYTYAGKLERGLYYWKLLNEEELLYVGKFLVE